MTGGGADVTGPPAAPSGWQALIRSAPLGVLVLSALLFFLGAGLVLAGVYFGIARGDTGWVPWTMALAVGPTALYLALHLLRRTGWAWTALVALFALLLVSSAVRAVSAPGLAVSSAVELALEGLILLYLTRRPVRGAFGRTGPGTA